MRTKHPLLAASIAFAALPERAVGLPTSSDTRGLGTRPLAYTPARARGPASAA